MKQCRFETSLNPCDLELWPSREELHARREIFLTNLRVYTSFRLTYGPKRDRRTDGQAPFRNTVAYSEGRVWQSSIWQSETVVVDTLFAASSGEAVRTLAVIRAGTMSAIQARQYATRYRQITRIDVLLLLAGNNALPHRYVSVVRIASVTIVI